MGQSLRRHTALARVLPPISPALYAGSPDLPSPLWSDLLKDCDPLGLPRWRRLTGWCSDGRQRIQHLLELHRSAFEAECLGQWARADYFWNEAHTVLRRLWNKLADWQHAGGEMVTEVPAERLRQVLRDELFMDTHIAVVNGRLAAEGLQAGDRAFLHVRWLSRLMALCGDDWRSQFDTVIAPALFVELDLLERDNRFDEAIERLHAEERLAQLPDLLDRLGMLIFRRTVDRLSPEPDGHELADAAHLEQSIHELEKLRQQHPSRLLYYDLLARLHHMHSVRLANGGRLSRALVESAKAAAFAPDFEDARHAMDVLCENMHTTQAQVKAVLASLVATPGSQLNDEGKKLKSEADRGFKPLERFRASGEPELLSQARAAAAEVCAAQAQAHEEGARAYPQPEGVAPLAMAPAATAERRAFPALRWWFGTQDTGTRGLAVAALACGLATVVIVSLESEHRRIRLEALQAIHAAEPQAHETIMAAAERFLEARSFMGSDGRRNEVIEVYAKAFTRWFAEQDQEDTDAVRRRVERYRQFAIKGDRS